MLAACGSDISGGSADGIEIAVGASRLEVWLADESAERLQGLSELEALPNGIDGLLFVWPSATTSSFNMRDVAFPLDIWWFDAEMVLIGKTLMQPCVAGSCTSYGSPGEVGSALETPAGDYDFEPGSLLSIVEND